ncbi:hypothetical protein [Bordetella bronchiseptica]|nr:hypothetical protein [Bordetella bronchiseptica]
MQANAGPAATLAATLAIEEIDCAAWRKQAEILARKAAASRH